MHAAQHQPFTWFQLFPPLASMETQYGSHVLSAILVTALVSVFGLVAVMQTRRRASTVVPEKTVTTGNLFEMISEALYGFCESVLGEHEAAIYFPFVASLFLFVFCSNFLGLIPGFLPPTDNMNTTLAIGAFVFLFYNFQGVKAHGIGYLKHFLGPVLWLAPLMFVIELITHVMRPLSLALRLRGNIMGDHVVLHVFTDLVPYLVPVIFYGMGVFVSFIQAFVFCLLTMVYISMATAHDH